ncbi:hypothetical protein Esti_006611 [Eimeria stiedai]
MRPAAALDLRRLKAALWALGLGCSLPPSEGLTRFEFILVTLLKLKHFLEPQQFSGEETASGAAEGTSLFPGGDVSMRGTAATALTAIKTPEERIQLLQQLSDFMQQRLGVGLSVSSLAAAEGPAVSELCRLMEPLAAATKAALKRRQQGPANPAASGAGEEALGSTEAIPANDEALLKNPSSETVEKIKSSAVKLLSSLQWFYGEAQVAERKAAASFLEDLLGGRGPPEALQEGDSQGASEGGPPPVDESYSRGRALLLQRLEQARAEAAEVERNNEVLENHIREIKEKIKAADNDAERLKRQLLLLKRAHGSSGGPAAAGAAASEYQVQQQQQQKLREVYLDYARRSAACDALMASVEDLADRAEAAAALSRRRMHEAARQRVLQHEAAAAAAAGASAAYSHSSACIDTLCEALSEELGPSLAASGHLCTEGSELDLTTF